MKKADDTSTYADIARISHIQHERVGNKAITPHVCLND